MWSAGVRRLLPLLVHLLALARAPARATLRLRRRAAGADLIANRRLAPRRTDLDLARLRQRRLRDAHAQDAVLEVRLDLVLIHALRELERAAERAIGALHHVIARVLVSLPALVLLLAAHRQHAVLAGDVHFLGLDPRQLDLEGDLLLVLADIHH